jgi:hypothetical protein
MDAVDKGGCGLKAVACRHCYAPPCPPENSSIIDDNLHRGLLHVSLMPADRSVTGNFGQIQNGKMGKEETGAQSGPLHKSV